MLTHFVPSHCQLAASPRRSAGFSLIELMVATLIMGMVIVFVLGMFTVQHQTYMVVDQVAETQQNSRAIAGLVERDIRNAGYKVHSQGAACGVDSTSAPDILFLSDAGAIAAVDTLPANLRGVELGASPSGSAPIAPGALSMTLDDVVIDATPTYDTDGDGSDDSDFREGGGAILVDLTNPARGVACGFVTSVTAPNAVVVDFQNILGPAGLPPDLRLIPAISYQVTTPVGAPDRLERNGVALAKDVEDIQIALFFDADEDGEVDANEYVGGAGTVYDNTIVDGATLREMRFSMVVRTAADDPRNPTAASTGQAIENRSSNIPGDDGRRRRVHVTAVRLRNVQS